MALNKKFFPKVAEAAADTNLPSSYFNTVLYEGNGGTQRIGGYINRGGVFNGSSSTIDLDGTAGLTFGSSSTWSMSFWVNSPTIETNTLRLFTSTGSGGAFAANQAIMLFVSGKIYYYYTTGTTNAITSQNTGSVLSNNTWHHIVITQSSGTHNVYLDGVAQSFTSNANTIAVAVSNIRFGTDGTASNYYDGKLDQVRIFNKALSSSEVTTLYGETHSSTTISTTDIFNDDSGVALYQLDGNANDTGGVSGKFGSAAIFNGSSSYIDAGNINLGTSNVSVSLWVHPNSSQVAYANIIDYNHSSSGGWTIQQDNTSTNSYKVTVYDGSSYNVSSAFSLTANQWNHVVFTVTSAGAYSIYVDNGTPTTGTGLTGLSSSTNNTLNIGRWISGTSRYWNGKIDDVRIYSDALTSTEVGYIYNNTTASIPTDNLVAYYKFDGDARDEQQLYDGTASNVTYAYDGTATNVTYQEATNFQPDLVWIKNRDASYSHMLYDSIRGAGQDLSSDTTNAEGTVTGLMTSFDTNGFTVVASGSNRTNFSGDDYVAWCFNAGTDAAASNTDGSITSTVKANTDAGFSIVSYTGNGTNGATVGHGLSSTPELVIWKNLSAAYSWTVYDKDLTSIDYYLRLNATNAEIQDTRTNRPFGAPSSTLLTIGEDDEVNTNNSNYVAYCFHSVDGFQKVGSYTGTGSANNIIETGFEPAWLMIKKTSGTSRWRIVDNKRDTENPRSKNLFAEDNIAETGRPTHTTQDFNFLSNGFEIPAGMDGELNSSGDTFIYLAIAADPDTTTPTVENSFDVVTYTGDGGTQSIDTDFKPDLVWIKNRDATHNHVLFDSVRGDGNSNGYYDRIMTNTTDAQQDTITDAVSSIDSNSFTVVSAGSGSQVNNTNDDYVAWCWKAGDHDDNLPQINTEGTIDSVVSVNDAAGFSIVQWEGDNSQPATIGHGLSAAPELIIHKDLDSTTNWHVYHESVMNAGDAKFLRLNTTNSILTDGLDDVWTSGFSATTFGVGKANNNTGRTQIAYCFTSITGYQKVGSYTGTGATGNVINVGFKPRWIMFKRTDSTGVWFVLDGIRNTSDVWSARIEANKTNAEAGPDAYTVTVSNTGFEMTGSFATYSEANASGGTYIYLAIK